MTNYSGTELPWTGGRPWRILDECEASSHNMLNVARGRAYRRGPAGEWSFRHVVKCICPGGAAAIKADNEGRRARTKIERERKQTAAPELSLGPGSRRTNRPGAWVPNGTRMPNFEDAACRGLLGRRIMDQVISSSGGSNTKAVKQAKTLCASCPIRETLCFPYVTKAEEPAGAWYGVWAGMTQTERRTARGLKR